VFNYRERTTGVKVASSSARKNCAQEVSMKGHAAALKITGSSLCALLLASTTVAADPIFITSGALVASRDTAADVFAIGTGGFQLVGDGDFSGGRFEPYTQCFSPPECAPGSPLSLYASWSGTDFIGTVTFDGATYPMGSLSETTASAAVEFLGSVIAPAFDGRTVRVVSAPFTFTGVVTPPATIDQGPSRQLRGAGTATLQLNWIDNLSGQYWLFERGVYAFEPVTPVPEPGTMALLALGLSGMLARRVRRRP
jgi:hypothetical protein